MSGAATGGARTPTPKRQQPAPLTADELTALIVDTCMALLICGGLVLCLVAVFVP